MNRREFAAALGGGILVLLAEEDLEAQESGRRTGGGQPSDQLSAWLHVGEDGAVTVYTGKVEVGQNTRTALTQAVAEELRAPLASIRMVMGDTDLTPYDAGTFGSQSTPRMSPQLRKAAAAAREMLLDLAAEEWKVGRAEISVADGRVMAGARSAGFGELTRGRKLTRTIASAVTAPAASWKVMGAPAAKVGARAIVTGAHRYTPDHKLTGMRAGKVLRPPALGATLASLDVSAAEAMAGVRVVRDGDFAVTAPDEATAVKALAALKAEWRPGPAMVEPAGLYRHLRESARAANLPQPRQTYQVAYIAHCPLEPRAALAEWKDGKLTVWTGTQRPFGVKAELVSAFGLAPEKVRVIVPDTGSGYGGKHSGEAAVEAARLARGAGAPVQLVWTRQEEFTWAYFRPAGVIEMSGETRKDGTISAWEHHNFNSGASGVRTPYHVPGARCEYHPAKSPLRQGSYRALAATANHFARECFMDELAFAAGMDPLEFRLRNASDERLRGVLEAAAAKFNWKGRKKGSGIAAGFEKGGYVATCVEAAAEAGQVRVLRVVEAFECGAAVNPVHLRNQIEGAIVMGLGGALTEEIGFGNGKILTDRFSRYRVPRFADAPPIETVILDRKDIPSAGAGETPIVGIAPAIANAVFDATSRRLRSLPLRLA